MKHFQVLLTFNPDQACMSRPGRFGVWRVRRCVTVTHEEKIRVSEGYDAKTGNSYDRLSMMVSRPYMRGVMVNPAKLAIDYLRHVHARRHAEEIEQAFIIEGKTTEARI